MQRNVIKLYKKFVAYDGLDNQLFNPYSVGGVFASL